MPLHIITLSQFDFLTLFGIAYKKKLPNFIVLRENLKEMHGCKNNNTLINFHHIFSMALNFYLIMGN